MAVDVLSVSWQRAIRCWGSWVNAGWDATGLLAAYTSTPETSDRGSLWAWARLLLGLPRVVEPKTALQHRSPQSARRRHRRWRPQCAFECNEPAMFLMYHRLKVGS